MPTVTRRPPYQAHLRVFEPVAHLAPADRERWNAYARRAPSRHEVERTLYADTVRRLAGRPPVPVPAAESTDALLLDEDGELFVSPVQPRLQVWHRLGAADLEGDVLPGDAVPEVVREQAAADLARLAVDGGEVRLFSRTAAWQVPLPWFVLFSGSERDLSVASPRRLTYRTSMSQARRRVAIGLRTARAALGDAGLASDIEVLGRWLEEFDHRSRVELDYAGLADLLDDAHLAGDDSASDVEQGLAALAEEDVVSAAAAYRRWTRRWQRVARLATAS
ncbi:hypothetical protein ASD06_16325 [Angustibacter sp. Root456]|nr:hypothetical protein ASD06_16325 [Angustibacter sp. Root456]